MPTQLSVQPKLPSFFDVLLAFCQHFRNQLGVYCFTEEAIEGCALSAYSQVGFLKRINSAHSSELEIKGRNRGI